LHAALLFNACSTLVTEHLFALLHCFGALLAVFFFCSEFSDVVFHHPDANSLFFSKIINLFFPKKVVTLQLFLFETNFVAFVCRKSWELFFWVVNMNNFANLWEKIAIF
jgi:hypothetical protein